MYKESRPKPRKSLTENFKNEILKYRIHELKTYINKLRSQIKKFLKDLNIY